MGRGGGEFQQEKNNGMVLHALGNICMTTHIISHHYSLHYDYVGVFFSLSHRGTSGLNCKMRLGRFKLSVA